MIPLPLCCPLPCVKIPFSPTTLHLCGNSALVNTKSTESLNLAHKSPQKSAPLLICRFPLSPPLLVFVSRLNLVFTLSYIFMIPLMVMRPFIPLIRSSHLRPLSLPHLSAPLLIPILSSLSKSTLSIIQCLSCILASIPDRKNILKKLDYNTLQIEEVNFLPSRFDCNMMFVLLPGGVSASHMKAKSMDKRYDGHVWTKTQTTIITNVMGISFHSSTCVGHLQCQNPQCDYLQCAH